MKNHGDLVVAKYKEDTSWTSEIRDWNVIVYDKGIGGRMRNEIHGREAHTFLYYVVSYYDILPREVVLVQGNPFDHCPAFLDELRDPQKRYYGYVAGCDPVGMPHCDFADLHNFCTALELPILSEYRFVSGAQYRLTREQIKSRSRDFYAGLLMVSKIKPHAAYSLERLWPLIFSLDL